MKVSVSREEHFNAAHRLFHPAWSDEKNFETFGKCSYPNYHGHNYRLIVTVTGEPNPETGYVMDLKKLSDIVRNKVLRHLDHKNLNLDTLWFKDLNPTAENIAVVIWDILRKELDSRLDLKIRLYETERNSVDVPAA